MAAIYGTVAFSTVACTATVAKTVVGINPAANTRVRMLEYKMSFDGANSANAPCVVEFQRNTFATNAPGTNSTGQNPRVIDQDVLETVQTVGGITWTAEPTVLLLLDSTDVGQFNGVYHYIAPFAAPFIGTNAKGFSVRNTSPNNVNCSGKIECEE